MRPIPSKPLLPAVLPQPNSNANPSNPNLSQVLMYLDQTIGELVEYLEVNGWMDNSIIVVASDNGGCPSLGGSNYPLRGIKHSYWEGGTKVSWRSCVRSTGRSCRP